MLAIIIKNIIIFVPFKRCPCTLYYTINFSKPRAISYTNLNSKCLALLVQERHSRQMNEWTGVEVKEEVYSTLVLEDEAELQTKVFQGYFMILLLLRWGKEFRRKLFVLNNNFHGEFLNLFLFGNE